MADTISWAATAATILAALMTASNLGSRVTGYGFVVFTFGALCWIAVGALTNQPALMWTNIVLTVVDIFGVWRWLGRQARVEEGARSASEASEHTPGESLFPATLLSSGDVVGCHGGDIAKCVDAMIGCRSGSIRYLVVSQGGIGTIGETFHRLDWDTVQVVGDAVEVHMDEMDISVLPELKKDEWPGR
jgi:sporulation protein YlmC with PRC-barrel domain